MIVCLVLYLHYFFLAAVAQSIPDADHTGFVPDSEGDLIFLLDSSGSVSYYEFAKVREFIGNLLRPFNFGPKDVQASIVHISSKPVLEFPFNQYGSSQEIQRAIQNMKQQMGDTNTGKALSYIKENLFEERSGSRTEVPKVMVWVTDGLSTDDISQPMQLLKDMGVTVFIVSTGRGNYLELSAAASKPSDTHLHFVDVDDLHIITKELRESIIELIRARRLHAQDITTTSFRLTWPRLLSRETGYYLLEHALVSSPEKKLSQTLSGDQTGITLHNLTPDTAYQVTLLPESNVHYIQPQTIQVSTLPDMISPTQILISEPSSHSFRVSWGPTLDSVDGYEIQYGPLPSNAVQTVDVDSSRNSTVLENLKSNTTYLVTVTALYQSGGEKALSAIACTEENDNIRYLHLEDLGSNKVKATWSTAEGEVQGYLIKCQRQVGSLSEVNVGPQADSVILNDMEAGTTSKICVIPVYANGAGKNLCKTVKTQSVTGAKDYPRTK